MSALERLIKLRDNLLSLDSGSGESADINAVLYVAHAANEMLNHEGSAVHIMTLSQALAALTKTEGKL